MGTGQVLKRNYLAANILEKLSNRPATRFQYEKQRVQQERIHFNNFSLFLTLKNDIKKRYLLKMKSKKKIIKICFGDQ